MPGVLFALVRRTGLTIFISLIVAMLRTKRLILTTAGPSNVESSREFAICPCTPENNTIHGLIFTTPITSVVVWVIF